VLIPLLRNKLRRYGVAMLDTIFINHSSVPITVWDASFIIRTCSGAIHRAVLNYPPQLRAHPGMAQ